MTENNKDTPPEALTRFVPDSSVYGNFVTWEIKRVGQYGDRFILCKKPLVNFKLIVGGVCLAAVGMVGSFVVKHSVPEMSESFAHALFWFGCFLGAAFPAFNAFVICLDSLRWKDKVRLQFDGSSEVLQLPCDEVEYRPDDYKRLIVGYTTGYCFYKDRDSGGCESITISAAQFYLLVQDKNNVWKRHDLGIAKNRRHARKTIEKLQVSLHCESFERKMKRSECKKLNPPNYI